jgi:hypothetical protein
MESTIVTTLIDDIVDAVYPDQNLLHERYVLTQLLYLLVFLSRRKCGRRRDQSNIVARALMKRLTQH